MNARIECEDVYIRSLSCSGSDENTPDGREGCESEEAAEGETMVGAKSGQLDGA